MQSRNKEVIEKAFLRMQTLKHRKMISLMRNLLPEAVRFALDFHELGPDPHFGHLEMGDDYGWMLIYNGVEVDREIYTADNKVGDVNQQLTNLIPKLKRTGYVGVVMAGMQEPAEFFSVEFEEVVLEETIKVTKQNFSEYFHKI